MSESLQTTVTNELTAIAACLRVILPGCRVLEAFEFRRAAELSVPSLTIGVKAVRQPERYLARVAGYKNGALTFADAAEVDYEVTVHCPVADGGAAGRRMQTAVADALRLDPDLAFVRITAGAPSYDRMRRCLCLPLTLTAHYLL